MSKSQYELENNNNNTNNNNNNNNTNNYKEKSNSNVNIDADVSIDEKKEKTNSYIVNKENNIVSNDPVDYIECPVCSNLFSPDLIHQHIDRCLENQ